MPQHSPARARLGLILAVVVGLALAPSTASATVTLSDFQRAVAVAQNYWQTPGRCTVINVQVDSAPPADHPEFSAWAKGVDGHCVIHYVGSALDSVHDWQLFCEVTVHEVGHLNGLSHSPYPANIMYRSAPRHAVPGCQPRRGAPVRRFGKATRHKKHRKHHRHRHHR